MTYRSEYPRPSFMRENWLNLNGEWEFYNDTGASGADRKVYLSNKFDGRITVPFCPESKFSGVQNIDFMPSVWYAKNITINKEQLCGRVILHFGACDYLTTVYVNGKNVGKHIGGYTSFEFDITEYLIEGNNRIVVNAYDNMRSNGQSVGKQSREYYSHLCDYTRTSGIWQTVWLEFVPEIYLKNVKVTATDLNGMVVIEPTLSAYAKKATLKTKVSFGGKCVCSDEFALSGTTTVCAFKVNEPKLWGVGEPNLYDIKYELVIDGKPVDKVNGYFGIRRIDIDGYKVLINGKSVFQRLVLDQGFYPDGIYTAPSDEALKKDIELSMRLGFNGARLHQKVFEERYLYHADKAGYLVWGEFPDWGIDISKHEALHEMLPQWLETVERDYNHPCIIGWCPHNETWDFNNRRQLDTNISIVYDTTKQIDGTRPVIDASGFYHTGHTDIFDTHDYEQNGEILGKRMKEHDGGSYHVFFADRQSYDGKIPFMISECGGIRWSKEANSAAWGYGDSPKTVDEFTERYKGIVSAIMSSKTTFGFCYTQLTDVEQEQNGLYYYDRTLKFTEQQYEIIRKANKAKAAIEEK